MLYNHHQCQPPELFIILNRSSVPSNNHSPSVCLSLQPLVTSTLSVSMKLPVPRTACGWNHTICVTWGLACFLYYDVFWAHACSGMHPRCLHLSTGNAPMSPRRAAWSGVLALVSKCSRSPWCSRNWWWWRILKFMYGTGKNSISFTVILKILFAFVLFSVVSFHNFGLSFYRFTIALCIFVYFIPNQYLLSLSFFLFLPYSEFLKNHPFLHGSWVLLRRAFLTPIFQGKKHIVLNSVESHFCIALL